jgi:hypothetical protein
MGIEIVRRRDQVRKAKNLFVMQPQVTGQLSLVGSFRMRQAKPLDR